MKILHLYRGYYPEIEGGIPYIIRKFIEIPVNMIENEVLVASKTPEISCHNRVIMTKSYGSIFSIPVSPSYLPAAIKRLANYDIIVAHTPFPIANLILLFARGKQKQIIFWHADILKNKIIKLLLSPIIKWSLNKADAIIIGHNKILQNTEILRKFHKKCFILPFPVDEAKFSCNQLDKIPHRVVACGRLVKYKGFLNLIEAAKHVNAEFIIIGEGPERDNLEHKIAELKLEKKIKIVGHISDDEKIAYLKSAAIFVFPSITEQETFGIAQLEAMAAGCAIINTNIGTAVPLIARNQREALTIDPNNPKQLADSLQLLLADHALRSALSCAGVERARNDFSKEKFQENVRQLMSTIMGQNE
jgi:glycosyltransferase involved in cell wall biosynthesis